MPVRNKLSMDGHILYRVITDPWTVEEVLAADEQMRQHYDRAAHQVHLLANISGARHLPPAVYRLGRGMTLVHPNSGQIVLVGATALTRRLSQTIFRIARFDRFTFVETEDNAWIYLYQVLADEAWDILSFS